MPSPTRDATYRYPRATADGAGLEYLTAAEKAQDLLSALVLAQAPADTAAGRIYIDDATAVLSAVEPRAEAVTASEQRQDVVAAQEPRAETTTPSEQGADSLQHDGAWVEPWSETVTVGEARTAKADAAEPKAETASIGEARTDAFQAHSGADETGKQETVTVGEAGTDKAGASEAKAESPSVTEVRTSPFAAKEQWSETPTVTEARTDALSAAGGGASLAQEGTWVSAESANTMTVAAGSGSAGRLLVAVVVHSSSSGATTWKATVSGGGLTWSRAGGGTDAVASLSGWVDIWTAVDATGGSLTVSAAPNSPGDAPGRTWVTAVTGSTGVRQIATGTNGTAGFLSAALSTSLIFGGAVDWAGPIIPSLGAGDSWLTGSAGTSGYATSDSAAVMVWKRSGDGTAKASGPLTGNINVFGAVEIKA